MQVMYDNMKTIQQIRTEIREASIEDLPRIISENKDDYRLGVKRLLEASKKKIEKYEEELKRLDEMTIFEKEYADIEFICGIDEAGRGPLAGPVVAGAVVLPKDCRILYLNDSKQLKPKKRELLYDEIMEKAICAEVGIVEPSRVDEINILQATYEAMKAAIEKLSVKPGILLNDAVVIPDIDIEQVPIVKGDSKSVSIAAASIIAKVTRDRLMVEYDKAYPNYGFLSNKGYGTPAHIEAVKKYGPSPIHRRTFIKDL